MIADDVARIEQALQIELPTAYRAILVNFPLPAYAGNADTDIWDDADRLIQYNQELRTGSRFVKPWPVHFYAIGRDAGGSSQALDLGTGDLWWADHTHLDGPGSCKHGESFEQWAATYVDGLRDDLVGEGGDPSANAEERLAMEGRNARGSARQLGLAVVLLGLLALLAALWRR